MIMLKQIEVNQYIEKLSDIKAHLDEIGQSLVTEVTILNDGCSNKVVNRIVQYLENLDIQVTVESKGVNALNRLYGF